MSRRLRGWIVALHLLPGVGPWLEAMSQPGRRAFLMLTLAVGLSWSLAVRGLQWGVLVPQGGGSAILLHPDEDANRRAVAESLARPQVWLWAGTDLWPYFFKGQFYYTQLRLLSRAFDTPGDSADLVVHARVYSALHAVGAVLSTGALGWALAGPIVGGAAALLLAACPGLAANAHYMTQDVPLTAWAALLAFLLVRAARAESGLRLFLVLGAGAGLATATKHSAWPLLVPILLAAGRTRWKEGLAASGAFVAALLAADPMLWHRTAQVVEAARLLAENNRHGVAYHLGRWPGWIDYAVSVLPYAMGTPLVLLSAAGLVLMARERTRAGLLLLTWVGLYWAMMGFDNVRVVRYTLPLLPVLCVAAASLLTLERWKTAAALGLLSAGLWGAAASWAYTGAMDRPDPRYQALLWMAKELRPGASAAMPRKMFALPPTPPWVASSEVGFDWDALVASRADTFIRSDHDWLEYKEAAAKWPQQADFIRRMEAGDFGPKAAEFKSRPMLWGREWPRGWPPHDWLYPTADIVVYRRSAPPPQSRHPAAN